MSGTLMFVSGLLIGIAWGTVLGLAYGGLVA